MTGVTFVSTKAEKDRFIRFPYQHYKGDTYWVAPLLLEQKKLLDVKKNPFYQNAEIALFLAEEDGEPAGRIAAIIDHRFNRYHNSSTGFFGFFESIDSRPVTELLFRAAGDWLKARGMNRITGPANPSMMDEVGILVDGFESYPYLMMPYHKLYYNNLLERVGLQKEMDLYAYEVSQDTVNRQRMQRAADIVRKRTPGLAIRPIDSKNLKKELEIVRHIFNESWNENWGFIPVSMEELEAMGENLKMILDVQVAHIAEVNGEPVAFSIAFPDYNQVFRKMNGRLFPSGIFKLLWYRRKIDRIRTALMGVLPAYRGKGIDALLHQKAIDNGLKVGYHASELSWILESNTEMIRVAEKIGGTRTKTYRFYQKELV
ncbi:MAG: GNAT family N-acetyltransferase [Balneolaceae bacterium]